MRVNFFQLNYSLMTVVSVFVMTAGCSDSKDNERHLAVQREAPEKIDQSIQVQASVSKTQNSNRIILLKENLGKAFMLIPVATTTGRNPEEMMLSPRIISFERAGDRIALFNLSQPQLYDNMKSEKLLQTFSISEENEKSVVVNLSQGFTSLDVDTNMGVIMKEVFDPLKKRLASGNETSLDVKDSFVRNLIVQENSIIIEQMMRIKSTVIEEQISPSEAANKDAKPKPVLVSTESSGTFVFEIKPYRPSPAFQSKIYDKDQRIGFFLNFAVEKQKDEPLAQITKWDIAEERGPIEVQLSNQTPSAVRESMKEGVLYWNKVFGREVLIIGKDFSKKDYQKDRSIRIFWIPWDTAGFARAGFQADPLTGEIIRGQVFMTSSWYRMTQNDFKFFDKQESEEAREYKHFGKCLLDQKSFLDMESLAATKGILWSEQAAQDTVRIVLAHEFGHALGLRHNFAGSSTAPATDADMAQARQNYIEEKNREQDLTSSTVMDYTLGLDTAINGRFIKNGVMVYDKAAIDWAYLDKDVSSEKYNYCSDEHIMMAYSNKKLVYNCDRFDKNRNPVTSMIEGLVTQTQYKSLNVLSKVVNDLKQNKSSFAKPRSFEDILGSISFSSWDTYNFESYLYSQYSDKFTSIKQVVDATLAIFNGEKLQTDFNMSSVLANHSNEAGGYAALLKALMDVRGADLHFFENQVVHLFKTFNFAELKELVSPEEIEKIKVKMTAMANTADQQYEDFLLASLPPMKYVYDFDSATNSYKTAERKINSSFNLGDPKILVEIYLPSYKRSFSKLVKNYEANGHSLQLKMPDSMNFFRIGDYSRSLFSPSQYSLYYNNIIFMDESIRQFKKAAVANSLELLSAMNNGGTLDLEISSTAIKEALDKLDWDAIKGINRQELDPELEELKKWETNP